MLGWKVVMRRDASYFGQGIDGRRWDKPLIQQDGTFALPVGLLRQPGTTDFLPVTTTVKGTGHHWLWDPSGSTIIATLQDFAHDYAYGQATVLPLEFWHFLQVRDLASSRKLRQISHAQCAALLEAAAEDRAIEKGGPRDAGKEIRVSPLTNLLPAVKKLLPTAPERHGDRSRTPDRAGRKRDCRVRRPSRQRERRLDQGNDERGVSRQSQERHRRDALGNAAYSLLWSRRRRVHHSTPRRGRRVSQRKVEGRRSAADKLPLVLDARGSAPALLADVLASLAAKTTRKGNSEVAWLEFLKLWHELGIAELPGNFDIMEGQPEARKKAV